MAKEKKGKSKPSVKVRDMKAKKDPKGGAVDVFLKLGDIKGESSLKVPGLISNKLDPISTTTLTTDLKWHK